jgi:FkbM family methyltransferase
MGQVKIMAKIIHIFGVYMAADAWPVKFNYFCLLKQVKRVKMKKFIRSLAQKFGYDIVKYKAPYVRGRLDRDHFLKENQWLANYQFRTIIDVGANEGQFSDKMRLLFPSATIHAFEPIPAVFNRLKKNFSEDARFIAYPLGIGEQKGELEFWENEYSPSSSFLNLGEMHRQNFENAIESRKINVQVDTLDHIFEKENLVPPLLIKIDVQGYEDKVIRGAGRILPMAAVIICELSFVELYKGQSLFNEIYGMLLNKGFDYAGNWEQITSPETNQILQADGIFIKQA